MTCFYDLNSSFQNMNLFFFRKNPDDSKLQIIITTKLNNTFLLNFIQSIISMILSENKLEKVELTLFSSS